MKDKEKLKNPLKGCQVLCDIYSMVFHKSALVTAYKKRGARGLITF